LASKAPAQAAFFAARFFVPADLTADAALLAAHRRFIASARRVRPSGVSRTSRGADFCRVGALGSAAAFFAAHRFRSAADSRFRPSGVIPPVRFLAGLAAEDDATATGVTVPSTSRKAANARSIAAACCSSCAIISSNPFAIGSLFNSISTN
jgi:hypothetical protein